MMEFYLQVMKIGLIGANNLQLPLNAPYMPNLDSEEEGEFVLMCRRS